MGTSSIYGGQKDKSKLLPDDFSPTSSTGSNATWKGVKIETSRYVSSGGKHGSAKHIVSNYVKASGGAATLTRHSGSGIKAAGNIGSFFYAVKQNGVENTLRQIGIDFKGQRIENVFSRLVDVLASDSNTKDDGAARRAAQEALVGVYDYVEKNDMDIKSIDNMPEELMNTVLKNFMTEYIWATVLKDLEGRIEDKMVDVVSAKQREDEIKGVIDSVVSLEFYESGSLINRNVNDAVKDLTQHCYEVLEGTI